MYKPTKPPKSIADLIPPVPKEWEALPGRVHDESSTHATATMQTPKRPLSMASTLSGASYRTSRSAASGPRYFS